MFGAKSMFGVCLPLDLVQDLSRLRVTQILGKVNFFNDLTKKQREQLSAIMDVLYFNYDDVVFGEGEIGNKFYILVEGDFPTAFRSSGWMWLDGMCVCMRHTTSSLPACRTANCRLSCCRVAVPNVATPQVGWRCIVIDHLVGLLCWLRTPHTTSARGLAN